MTNKNNVEKKYKAIVVLVKQGSRASEWREAGLLRAIEEIINDEATDLSANGLKNLMQKAEKF